MIKANELRLGNICMMPSCNKVTFITAMDISDIQLGYKNRIPIPLTEDWLLKFGFTTDGITFDKIGFRVGHFVADWFIWLPNGSLSSSKFGVKINSVNQLQNLYCSVTGKELVISPTASAKRPNQ